MYSFPFHHAITYNLTHIIPLFSFNLLDTCKDCVVEGSAKCQTIQTIFKPNHQNGMKTMMYDVSQVVSCSGMMKGKGILLRYNCPSLHITFNIILGPIYLNLDLGLINWFIKHDSSPFQAWIELNVILAYPPWTILEFSTGLYISL